MGWLWHCVCWDLSWRSREFLVRIRQSLLLCSPPHKLHSAFKYCCRARGQKLEKTKITYGCLAKVVRDGGFKIALIARLSAIPGHCKFHLATFFPIIG
jgi:hypothetical protein